MKELDLDWDGRRCRVEPLKALPARQVARRLMNLVGQGLKEAALSGVAGASSDVVAVGAVLESMDDQTLTFLTDTFIAGTKIENEAGSDTFKPAKEYQDLLFGGPDGLKRWIRWLDFCVEQSCSDFFGELRALAAARQTQAMAKAMTKSPSPST